MKVFKYKTPHPKFLPYGVVLFDNYQNFTEEEDDSDLIVKQLFSSKWLKKLFINKFWYIPVMILTILRKPEIEYWHMWYDIQNHAISLVFFQIYWEGDPIIDVRSKKK